jgi:hypothetical protein
MLRYIALGLLVVVIISMIVWYILRVLLPIIAPHAGTLGGA